MSFLDKILGEIGEHGGATLGGTERPKLSPTERVRVTEVLS